MKMKNTWIALLLVCVMMGCMGNPSKFEFVGYMCLNDSLD